MLAALLALGAAGAAVIGLVLWAAFRKAAAELPPPPPPPPPPPDRAP